MRPPLTLWLVLLAAPLAAAGEPPAPEAPPAAKAEPEPVRLRITEPEADSLADRAARSDLVLVVEPERFREETLAECRVVSVLKGQCREQDGVLVQFRKVFGGAYPRKGETAVCFLTLTAEERRGRPVYALISETGGMAPPTPERLALLRLAAAGRYQSRKQLARLQVPGPETLAGMVLDAPFAALGVIEEVSLPAGDEAAAARISFRVEQVFKGELDRGPLLVYVPRVPAGAEDPARRPLAPRAGPAALMFYRRKAGGRLVLLSPYRGCVPVADQGAAWKETAARLAEAVRNEKRLRELGLVGSVADRDTVAATIVSWERAWNSRAVEECIACYSRRSPFRRKWESGPEGRKELLSARDAFRGQLAIVTDKIEEKDPSTAVASVRLRIVTEDQFVDVRPAEMTFAFENGQWLILDEGF